MLQKSWTVITIQVPVKGKLRLLFIENKSFKTILAIDIDCLPEFECKTILLQKKHNSDTELGRIELEPVQKTSSLRTGPHITGGVMKVDQGREKSVQSSCKFFKP